MGKVIESNLILEDFPETPLTLEQGLTLLGVKEVPGRPEMSRIFLEGLTSILKRKGETWVRFHRKVLVELFEHHIVCF